MTTPTTVSVRLQLRADTAANWTSANPTLLANELGRETDTGKIKIGDGSTAWSSLAYQAWATLPIAVASGGTGQTSYTNGQLLIGNTTGNTLTKATLTAGSGIAITNGTGSITVAASGISDAQIAADAEIAVSKLADGAARQLLQTDAAGTGVEWASNIDIPGTLDVTSAATFDSTIGASAGTASLPSITFTGDLNTGIYSPGADQVAISTGGSGRLFINSSGQVGIGVSPSATLEVNGESRFTRSGVASQYVGIAADGTDTRIVAEGSSKNLTIKNNSSTSSAILFDQAVASSYIFNQAGDERMRLDSSGRLGVGTSSPAGAIQISNAGYAIFNNSANSQTPASAGLSIGYNRSGANGEVSLIYGAPASGFNFEICSYASSTITPRLTIDTSGRVGVGTTPSKELHVYKASGTTTFWLESGDTQKAIAAINIDNNAYSFQSTYNTGGSAPRPFVWNSVSTEQMRLDTSGRLLVGTSSYSGNSAFVIKGGAAQNVGLVDVRYGTTRPTTADVQVSEIRFGSTDFTSNSAYANIQCVTDGASSSDADIPGRLVFSTTADGASSPTEAMRITNGQNICIARTSQLGPGRVSIDFSASTHAAITTNDTTSSSGAQHYRFYSGGTQVGNISTNTTATAYATSSDYRLKENVAPVTDGITRLQQLKPSRFNFIADPDQTVDGFLAHEVQDIVPEAITGEKDAVDVDGNPIYQGIDQSKLVPLLTAALQEAIGEIESLKARVAALESA